jgi:hypothetical protein
MLKNFAMSPQRRLSSGQPLELEHVQQLEEIAESGEQEEGVGVDQQASRHCCNAAKAGLSQVISEFLGVSTTAVDRYYSEPHRYRCADLDFWFRSNYSK